jgi:hypothetical protein
MSIAEHRGKTSERPQPRSAYLFRAVNERIRDLAGEWLSECEFICECDDETCTRVLRMTVEQYEAVRTDPAAFAVLPGHEQPRDRVLSRTEGLVIVYKRDDLEQPAVDHREVSHGSGWARRRASVLRRARTTHGRLDG